MREYLQETIPNVDALILEDYGKGVIQEGLLSEIVPMARGLGKIVTVDPKRDHFPFYKGVTAITPNRLEAEEATGIQLSDEEGLHEAGARLMARLKCDAVLITMGDQGMCLFEDGEPPLKIPARAREVYDVSGAGDTVIAVFTSALVAGATFRQAAMLSNVAGGLVVEKLGTAVVTREEIRARIEQFAPLG
jgi:rfaE bifunctional protein kinase chain/domain